MSDFCVKISKYHNKKIIDRCIAADNNNLSVIVIFLTRIYWYLHLNWQDIPIILFPLSTKYL